MTFYRIDANWCLIHHALIMEGKVTELAVIDNQHTFIFNFSNLYLNSRVNSALFCRDEVRDLSGEGT